MSLHLADRASLDAGWYQFVSLSLTFVSVFGAVKSLTARGNALYNVNIASFEFPANFSKEYVQNVHNGICVNDTVIFKVDKVVTKSSPGVNPRATQVVRLNP